VLDCDRLITRLYIGAAPKRGPDVAQAGFSTLVLCAEEYQPRLAEFPGLHSVIHAPLDDAIPTEEEIDTAMTAALEAADRYEAGERVLVTCMAGRNRSGLVSALALHFITCAPPSRCARLVQREREGALFNRYFVELLRTMPAAC
jgi:protein-tyrosine phosphatase